jgi:hypothetical protein
MVRSVTPAGRGPGPRFLPRAEWAGVLGGLGLFLPALVLTAWFAVHRISGLAPLVADGLRSVIGVDGVARLEEAAYGLEDRFNTLWRRGEKPRAYWTVQRGSPDPLPRVPERGREGAIAARAPLPPAAPARVPAERSSDAPSSDAGVALEGVPERRPEPAFRPLDVGPLYAELDAPGDGEWVALPDEVPPGEVRMFKTLLHPDPERAWAELFVVALDLRHVRVHAVPGTLEPQPTGPEVLDLVRPGRVPDEYHAGVLAAFNGGFKTEHGHYGMSVNGVTIVPPQEGTCTIAQVKDGSLRIGTWSKLRSQAKDAAWWRQTPACMYENDKMNPRLAGGLVGKWGSTLDGETVIRRSAMGIDATGTTLYVGISNHTTAPTLARGMHHAGASTVAQLDINFSYPKFVTFRESAASKLKVAVPLAEGFDYSANDYLRKPQSRDFFYVMDSSMDGRTARN